VSLKRPTGESIAVPGKGSISNGAGDKSMGESVNGPAWGGLGRVIVGHVG